jgi:hypothetical protein
MNLASLFFRRRKRDRQTVGAILVEHGIITREELLAAVEKKMRSSGEQLLGEVLIAQGALTRNQLERALEEQRRLRGSSQEYAARAQAVAVQTTSNLASLHGQLDELSASAQKITRPAAAVKIEGPGEKP